VPSEGNAIRFISLGPRPSMKADISTLHKPDILTLRRHGDAVR